jgi:hypothetical protein
MQTEEVLTWFKENASNLRTYKIEYKFFEKGDFGSLNQIEFNSIQKGGNIDIWSTGWIGIHLVDYIEGNELMNLLLEPEEKELIAESLEKLLYLLQ